MRYVCMRTGDGWQLLGNTVAPGQQAVFRRNVTLTDGLYQVSIVQREREHA